MPYLEQLIGHVAARAAQGMRGDDRVSKFYARVVASFGRHVIVRWSAVGAAGVRCNIEVVGNKRCGLPAAGACMLCTCMSCLEHAHASVGDGSIVCHACVGRAQREFGVAPPQVNRSDDERRQGYLDRLSLRSGASIHDIKARYKKLARKKHPDRATAAERPRFEAEMKEINEAFAWLVAHTEDEAA